MPLEKERQDIHRWLTTGLFNRRWIRLLFGREFPFEEVLCLWDIIFAEDPLLDLIEFICVAMLLRIRWQRKSENPGGGRTRDETDVVP